MNHKDTGSKASPGRQDRSFRQLLTVALVCLVFISLFLISGKMNMRALDSALTGYMEKGSMSIINTVQQATGDMFRHLGTVQPGVFDPVTGALRNEDLLSMEQNFINGLIDLVREMDLVHESIGLDQEAFASYLSSEGLAQVSFLDEGGQQELQNSPIPPEVLKSTSPVIRGDEMFKTNIFTRTQSSEPIRFIALRRSSGKGSVILTLDEDGFRYRRMRFCLQGVLEDMLRVPDRTYTYLVAHDPKGRVLGKIGTSFEDGENQAAFEKPSLAATNVTTRKILVDGQNMLEISAPLYIADEPEGVVRLGLKADDVFQILSKNRRNLFVSMGFMVTVTLLSMGLLHRNQTRYLKSMQEMGQRIHQAERLAALGRFAAGVAHEIRNPLNAISMGVQRIHKDTPHKLTKVIRDEIRRLNRIIEDFIGIAKSRDLEFSAGNLIPLLDQIILLVAEDAESKGVRIRTQWPDKDLMVSMDRDKIKQALLNIIKNAVESIPDTGTVTISMESRGSKWRCLKITDTGVGMAPDQIKHIFDMDYTTKDKGLGFGLPLAHEIIKGHGGEMHVSSQPGAGTVVEILLPLL